MIERTNKKACEKKKKPKLKFKARLTLLHDILPVTDLESVTPA